MPKLKDTPELSISDILTMLIPVVPDDTVTDVWNNLTYEILELALLIHSKRIPNTFISRRQAVNSTAPSKPTDGDSNDIDNDILDTAPTGWVIGLADVTSALNTELWFCDYDVDIESNIVNYSEPYKWPGIKKLIGGTGITVTDNGDGEFEISLT